MNKTLVTIALVDGVASAVIISGVIFAQVSSFQVSNGWGLAALLALLAFQAYTFQVQKKSNDIQNKGNEIISTKVDNVHNMLNSELAKFKADSAEAYRVALEQGITLAKQAQDKVMSEKLSIMESKIVALENKLDSAREKAVALAIHGSGSDPAKVVIDSPNPMPVTVVTPEQRHEELKGGG